MKKLALLNSRYRIEERIGSGGMADVYRAYDLMLERMVAVKILHEDLSRNSTFRDRFHQEAKSAANLSHPSIVTIHDFGLDGGKLFLVMEHIAGANLKSIIQVRGRFHVDEALPLFIQACAGLGYAHRVGLIHCDIKPHNMIITPDAQLKITDFGIARALTTLQSDSPSDIVWGSPQYFSPEQASGQALSPATDVYSLGVVMYEILTGRLPFDSPTASGLSLLHRTAIPPSPRLLNPEIPPFMEEILLKVLAKEPSARYRTADQLGRVLMSISHSNTSLSPISPLPDSSSWQIRSSYLPPRSSQDAIGMPQQVPIPNTSQSSPLDIDWITWILALLALIAIGGLIPLGLWVYLLYFSNMP